MLSFLKKHFTKHAGTIGILITIIVVALILYFALREVNTARTLVGFPLEQYQHSRRARVELRVDQFNSANLIFSGSARVSITPNISSSSAGSITYPSGEPEQTLAMKNAVLSLAHGSNEAGRPILVEQGSSEVIELKPTSGEVAGKGNFTWRSQSVRSSFWYPFDSYLLHLNPSLIVSTKDDGVGNAGFYEFIETMEVELGVPNLRMNLIPRQTVNSTDDRYEIVFQRPLALRVTTGIIGLLALIWLVYLYRYADPGNYIAQILTFFLGIWGVRTTLLAGFSVFPVMLDYATLTLSVMAVGIVLSKWTKEILSSTTTKCPHCKMKIPLEASRCPYCTSSVP